MPSPHDLIKDTGGAHRRRQAPHPQSTEYTSPKIRRSPSSLYAVRRRRSIGDLRRSRRTSPKIRERANARRHRAQRSRARPRRPWTTQLEGRRARRSPRARPRGHHCRFAGLSASCYRDDNGGSGKASSQWDLLSEVCLLIAVAAVAPPAPDCASGPRQALDNGNWNLCSLL